MYTTQSVPSTAAPTTVAATTAAAYTGTVPGRVSWKTTVGITGNFTMFLKVVDSKILWRMWFVVPL